ncbi:MAG: hypothetical protein LBJ17_02325 [Dysgonamonadaceae bacterium]|jgi:nitrite reductase/ring-hydroxylating ferredoxin subunit|nr:hypothetical protein [Dysgonamonadaceae bacterium]
MEIKRTLLIMILLAGFALSCEDEYTSPIPWFEVNLVLNLNLQDKELNSQGTIKTITARRLETDRLGYGGLLIINGYPNGQNRSDINLYAYDLSCPNEKIPSPGITVEPDTSNMFAVCPRCGEVYDITLGYGNPQHGQKHSLKTYRVTKMSEKQYRVTN